MTEEEGHRSAPEWRSAWQRLRGPMDVRLGVGPSVGVGLIAGLAGIALKASLNEILSEETGFVVLLAPAMVAAWFGGLTGGITATVAAVVLNSLLFLGPDGARDPITRVDQVRQILYLVVATVTTVLVASRRVAHDRLADALDEVAHLAEEIEARDARLELMLAASGTGLWEWDIPTGTLTWSETIFQQHGLEPGGRPPDFAAYRALVHPDDLAGFEAATAAALDDRHLLDHEFRICWSDGSVRWIHTAGRVFRGDEGRPIRMLGTAQDVTERRQLELQRDALLAEERRAAEFREAFIDVISHELRTPITTILGLAQLLARRGREDDPERQAAMLDDVRAESERLHRLVEDLLVLSRVERGRLDVESEPLHLGRLLERIVARERTELPTLRIRLEMSPVLPVVLGEATYVEQILRNLLGNAAKYTPRDSNVVVQAMPEGETVAIRVRDDGPGIGEASRDRLFELFYRDPSSARTASGSGIGLFVCASLVEAMGGRIWVGDAPGGGAEFGFTLRAVEADSADSADSADGAVPGPVDTQARISPTAAPGG